MAEPPENVSTIVPAGASVSSKAMLSYDAAANPLSNPGSLSAACSDGQLDIESTDASDASDVAYLIVL